MFLFIFELNVFLVWLFDWWIVFCLVLRLNVCCGSLGCV